MPYISLALTYAAGERMASTPLDRPAPSVSVGRPAARWAPSPRIGRRELLAAALGGVALALLVTWPLVLHLPSRIAPDLGDPVRTAWQIAWVGHALVHDPLHLFDSNAFYPNPLSLAFSDSLLGYGPAGLIGSGTVAALVRYDLLFLLAWSLCFLGTYLLARELGVKRMAATAAGVAFAYAPYRITEAGHLHVISSGGIPLSLFLLLRGYRRGSRALLTGGWLVAAWQISLGFTLGLQFAYLLAVLTLLAALWWWLERRRQAHGPDRFARVPPTEEQDHGTAPGSVGGGSWRGSMRLRALPRETIAITCAGIALCGVVTVYQARPYLKVAADYPTAKRALKEVKTYSAGPWAWLAASSENRVWGTLTAGARSHVSSKNESVFFPGGAIFVLAVVGAASPIFTRRMRVGLACGFGVCAVLALGFGLTGAGWPYRLLYDVAPGWNGVRVPGRVFTLATLCLALLAAGGVQQLTTLTGTWAARRGPQLRDGLPALLGAVLVVGILGEGAGHMAHPTVPQPARAEIGLPGPILDLPADGASDRIWQYFSTDGFPKIVNGNSTFDLPSQDDLRGGMAGFPDRASVEKLRFYGIHTVVLHLGLPPLPPLHFSEPEPPNLPAAAAKPVTGLGITRRRVGDVVIYTIGPGPKALHGSDG
jgi:hypothetical protein